MAAGNKEQESKEQNTTEEDREQVEERSGPVRVCVFRAINVNAPSAAIMNTNYSPLPN